MMSITASPYRPVNWHCSSLTGRVAAAVRVVSLALLLAGSANAQIVDESTLDVLAGVPAIMRHAKRTPESVRLSAAIHGGYSIGMKTVRRPMHIRGLEGPSGAGKIKYVGSGGFSTQ